MLDLAKEEARVGDTIGRLRKQLAELEEQRALREMAADQSRVPANIRAAHEERRAQVSTEMEKQEQLLALLRKLAIQSRTDAT